MGSTPQIMNLIESQQDFFHSKPCQLLGYLHGTPRHCRVAIPLLCGLEGLSEALLSAGGGLAGKEPGAGLVGIFVGSEMGWFRWFIVENPDLDIVFLETPYSGRRENGHMKVSKNAATLIYSWMVYFVENPTKWMIYGHIDESP